MEWNARQCSQNVLFSGVVEWSVVVWCSSVLYCSIMCVYSSVV